MITVLTVAFLKTYIQPVLLLLFCLNNRQKTMILWWRKIAYLYECKFLIKWHGNMIFPPQSLKPLGCNITKKLLRPCCSSFHESVSFTGSVYVQLELLHWEDKCGFKLFQPLMFRQFIGLFGLIFFFLFHWVSLKKITLCWNEGQTTVYSMLMRQTQTADVFRDFVFIKTLCVMFLQFSFLCNQSSSLFYIVVSAAFQPWMWELLCSLWFVAASHRDAPL